MDFRASPSRGGWIGLGAVTGLGALAWFLVSWIRRLGPSPRSALLGLLVLLLLILLVLMAYWTWGYFNLRYRLSRDGLAIRWGAGRQIVPMSEILRLSAGRPFIAPVRGLRWPGYVLGRTLIAGEAEGEAQVVLAYATQPPEGQLLVHTRSLTYAISPEDPAGFIEDFKRRRGLGPVQDLTQHTERPRWASLSIWSDPTALRALLTAFLLNALAFAFIAWQYPELPEQVVVQYQFDAQRGFSYPGSAQPLATVWRLPFISLAGFLLNGALAAGLHPRSRLAANMLLMGSAVVTIALILVLTRLG